MSSLARSRSRLPFVAAGAAVLGVAVVPTVASGEADSRGKASSSPKAAKAAFAGKKRKSVRPMRARLTKRGQAVAPPNAPWQVRRMIKAANRIAHKPYIWGGGHGSFTASGYDCSGSVSYVLHGANMLRRPMVSGALAGYGRSGRGKWVTIYAKGSHVYMVVAGLRFDTTARKQGKSRWTKDTRSRAGFAVRHPRGL